LTGLAFHPTQPLLAAALHNGSVQLWNYRMGVLVDRFEEHEGESTVAVRMKTMLIFLCDQALCGALLSILAGRCWLPEEMIIRSKSGVRTFFSARSPGFDVQ
jgi:hypothetical protein